MWLSQWGLGLRAHAGLRQALGEVGLVDICALLRRPSLVPAPSGARAWGWPESWSDTVPALEGLSGGSLAVEQVSQGAVGVQKRSRGGVAG